MWNLVLPDLNATLALGHALGQVARAGTVVGLSGDLGAGKTSFAQGVGAGLDVGHSIVSPTFILMAEYSDGRLPLLHADVYRLQEGEVEAIGLEDAVDVWDGVVLIEWAEKVSEIFAPDHLWVQLSHFGGKRQASIQSMGDHHTKVLALWREYFER